MSEAPFQRIVDERVIAVVRGIGPDDIVETARAIRDGGVGVIEVTADSPDATDSIARLDDEVSDILVGAGTVLDTATVKEVIEAGAAFVVSPVTDEAVIEAATDRGVVAIPGAFTPTEVTRGLDAGADAVKIFPAKTGGPAHLGAIRGPLGDVALIPTGGVDASNAGAFIEAGAVAVGAGSAIVDRDAVDTGAFGVIQENAAAVRESILERSG